ncbi:2'-5' RNA ligase family protein [Kocuria tytonis]|uniref:2'-5' RNA ligase family protein n=1 Tax=Kocuria tytonis TaxID=2054280 RepID=A0A495A3J5_9MICC|nr:2'-5' RNA ligase family protein [Kocuria tytonis]RKQ34096.1 2'-5' RNA ligase family protein [Kocuria tytonis]
MSEGQVSPTVRPGHAYAGVVIRLPDPVGRELQDWRESFGDEQAGTVPAHITLMISALEENWDDLLAHVRAVAARWEPFHVEIHGTGTFRPVTPVVYLRLERGSEQCAALHRELRSHRMESASPFEYHPHVTLAHGTSDEVLDRAQQMLRAYRAAFLVDRIHLYEGDERGAWHVRDSIPLGGTSADHRDAH